jgi:hypothetical protein
MSELVRRLPPAPKPDLVVRFEEMPGEYGQFDFGEVVVTFADGRREKLHVFASRLKFSRLLHVELTPDQKAETVIRALVAAFEAWGGAPREWVFDNPRTIRAAAKVGRLREATAEFVAPAVLVVDEVGYLHHADDAANVLFGVVDQRYLRKRPIVLTTNKRLKDWGDVLHNPDLAEVILDRILERGTHIALGGPSWRRKHLPETEDVDATPTPTGTN